MQTRSYAGYWFNRPTIDPGELVSRTVEAFGEIIIDFGSDGILDGGGNHDFIITPQGTSGNINSVKYRELTLENSSGQRFVVDVLHINEAINLGTSAQTNNGAIIPLNSVQWDAIPQDPTLRIVSFEDYNDPSVPQAYLLERGTLADRDGGGLWWNNAQFGTFVFDEQFSDFTYSRDANGRLVFSADDGDVDTVVGFERIAFADGTLAFDFEGIAGAAYRLYQAAFDRTPDVAGLGYWIDELDAGKGDLSWMANNFILSDEFRATYGTPSSVSNEDFLNLIYNNVLDRDADGGGFDYWMAEMERGLERERVLASFSESAENKANVADAISDGIWYV